MMAWHPCHDRVGALNVLVQGLRHECHGVGTKMALGYLGLDAVISPSPPNQIQQKGVWIKCANTPSQKAFLLHTPSHNQISYCYHAFMDDHCGFIIPYIYKYKIKLYICSQYLFPLAPGYQGVQDKTMQGVRHDINKICKMSTPMSKGVLWSSPPGPSQYSVSWDRRTKNILLQTSSPSPLISWPF